MCGVGVLVVWQRLQRSKDCFFEECESESHSVVSDSLRPHGLYSPLGFSRPEYCSG